MKWTTSLLSYVDKDEFQDLEELRKKQIKKFNQYLYAWEIFDAVELPDGFPFRPDYGWEPGYFGKVDYYLGETDRSWVDGKLAPFLKMKYQGSAESEEEAIQDLAEFQNFFRVLLRDGEPSFSSSSFQKRPKTLYKGVGRTPDGVRICITLECPWPPRGCVIEEVEETETKYKVSCARS